MQRLFSMFPEGWPGAGLVVLRATAAIPVLHDCGVALLSARVSGPPVVDAAGLAAVAAFLLAGLFTPVSGLLLGILEISLAFLPVKDPSAHAVAGALGMALAMTGPGAWSIDARLFGRKRIQIR